METGSATLDGRYFQVDGAIVRPLPIQRPGIPFWISGGGEKVTLRIAARYAQYTNFANGKLDEFTRKSEILRDHCDAVGRDYSEIVRSTNNNIVIGETEAEVKDRVAAIAARVKPYLSDDGFAREMSKYDGNPAVGTVEQVSEHLQALGTPDPTTRSATSPSSRTTPAAWSCSRRRSSRSCPDARFR